MAPHTCRPPSSSGHVRRRRPGSRASQSRAARNHPWPRALQADASTPRHAMWWRRLQRALAAGADRTGAPNANLSHGQTATAARRHGAPCPAGVWSPRHACGGVPAHAWLGFSSELQACMRATQVLIAAASCIIHPSALPKRTRYSSPANLAAF